MVAMITSPMRSATIRGRPSRPRQTPIGFEGRLGGRNATTVLNAGFSPVQFWDGRAGCLEEQAIGPIHNPIEMAETHDTAVPKIAKIPGYLRRITDTAPYRHDSLCHDRGDDRFSGKGGEAVEVTMPNLP